MYLFIGCNGEVAAIEPETGAEVWRTALRGTGVFGLTIPEDVCILEHDGRLFAGCNGHLFALDTATGKILWHNELSGLGHNDVSLAIAGKSAQLTSPRAASTSDS